MPLDVSLIETLLAKHTGFSGAVQVREGGEPLFARGYGFANRADEFPNSITTRFGIASGTKLFTGVAICQLVEKGKLTFDTHLKDVIDTSASRFDPAVTIHHLLTHSSGVPDYFDEEQADAQNDFAALWLARPTYTMRAPSDFLPMFQNEPMKFPPGQRFSYSNSGFILLGLVIEAVSGQAYIDYVADHIFRRSGMADSGFFALNQLPSRTALGYVEDDGGSWQTNIFDLPIIGGPDGGAFVTAPDFGRFWDALLAHRLLTAEMTRALLEPRIASNPERADQYYGYGIWMLHTAGHTLRYYAIGNDPGVSFVSTAFPASGVEITVIGNTGDGAWPVIKDILALV